MTFSKGSFTMSDEEYAGYVDENIGLCTNCGEESSDCEPDAHEYHCDACGQDKVYGAEELMIMNKINLDEDEETDDDSEPEGDVDADEDFDEGEGD